MAICCWATPAGPACPPSASFCSRGGHCAHTPPPLPKNGSAACRQKLLQPCPLPGGGPRNRGGLLPPRPTRDSQHRAVGPDLSLTELRDPFAQGPPPAGSAAGGALEAVAPLKPSPPCSPDATTCRSGAARAATRAALQPDRTNYSLLTVRGAAVASALWDSGGVWESWSRRWAAWAAEGMLTPPILSSGLCWTPSSKRGRRSGRANGLPRINAAPKHRLRERDTKSSYLRGAPRGLHTGVEALPLQLGWMRLEIRARSDELIARHYRKYTPGTALPVPLVATERSLPLRPPTALHMKQHM
uniref:Uncharacterized protein n=1 Tax=Sphaerodactylus townsendi TaxID=933632 RepID=A0ACB8F1D1_9SAUR